MPLFYPNATAPLPPAAAVQAVHGFLRRCRSWALEQEIPRRLEQVAQTNDPAAAAKLHEWVAYLQFTEHALRELEQGTLDTWFTGEPSAQPPTQ